MANDSALEGVTKRIYDLGVSIAYKLVTQLSN
jgi:hypothetical protein